jgi:hypothetical protein
MRRWKSTAWCKMEGGREHSRGGRVGRNGLGTYHEECPDGVVEENDGRGHKHGEADEFVNLWLGAHEVSVKDPEEKRLHIATTCTCAGGEGGGGWEKTYHVVRTEFKMKKMEV